MAGASKPWFKPLRGSYIAINIQGALTYLPFVAYLVFSMVIPFNDLRNKNLAVLFVVPNWIVAALVMTMLAKSKSK